MIKTDILVMGSGVAGSTFAIKAARLMPQANITIVSKAPESNTRFAQGGIAIVTDLFHDSFDQHIKDTMKAGDGHNDPEVVEMVIRTAPERLLDLLGWGAEFDTDSSGAFDLGREGGHHHNRILHYKDITGHHIEKILYDQLKSLPNIQILPHHFITRLITEENICTGTEIADLQTSELVRIYSGKTILAAGGAGQIYSSTTNPAASTGDGIALAYEAGAVVKDMEFVQFHPTALYQPGKSPAFLISEAVRGAGAELCDLQGKPFMNRYDPRGSLASRDIVARAIYEEMQRAGSPYIYLDCRQIGHKAFTSHFPNIYHHCLSAGIDPMHDLLPISPAAHYICGGIKTDILGRTSVENIYAIGECACTGLHGANRLASNSLLEGLVFAHQAASDCARTFTDRKNKIPSGAPEYISQSNISVNKTTKLRKQLQRLMMEKAGIVRSSAEMEKGLQKVKEIESITAALLERDPANISLLELKYLTTISILVLEMSLQRKENRGAFFNKDLRKEKIYEAENDNRAV